MNKVHLCKASVKGNNAVIEPVFGYDFWQCHGPKPQVGQSQVAKDQIRRFVKTPLTSDKHQDKNISHSYSQEEH